MPSLVFGCKQGFWHLMDRLKKSLPRRTHKHASPFISEFTKTMLQSAKDPQHPGALASHCFRFAIPMAVPTAVSPYPWLYLRPYLRVVILTCGVLRARPRRGPRHSGQGCPGASAYRPVRARVEDGGREGSALRRDHSFIHGHDDDALQR